jgi:hypothetical protein
MNDLSQSGLEPAMMMAADDLDLSLSDTLPQREELIKGFSA